MHRRAEKVLYLRKKSNMRLEHFLSEISPRIIKKWREEIIKTYPEDGQHFLGKEKDQFANPVGYVITTEIEPLFNELIKDDGGDKDKIYSTLDSIVKIRAIQDFKPSRAIGFILQLKEIIRKEFDAKVQPNGLSAELKALENKIDNIALLAFDIYMQCRQKIYEIRVNEVKNQVGKLLERANLLSEIPDMKPGL